MPLYDYECPKGHEFEDLQPMAERHTAPCRECGEEAKLVLKTLPRIDPNADLPGLRMLWRKNAERRGRGADMTKANREDTDEATHRQAYERRKALGETKIVSTG